MHPTEAVGQNEMPFGRDTHVVPNNTVLDKGPGAPLEGEIWGIGTPSMQRCRLLPNYIDLVLFNQSIFLELLKVRVCPQKI